MSRPRPREKYSRGAPPPPRPKGKRIALPPLLPEMPKPEDFSELERLPTESINPASNELDLKSTREILRTINREDATVHRAVRRTIPKVTRAVNFIVESLGQGGRLIYIGAGSSGRLGVLDAVECPPTFNIAPESVVGMIAGGHRALYSATEISEDDPRRGVADLRRIGVGPRDTVVGIAASGRTPYTVAALRFAGHRGAHTIAIACVAGSELARDAQVAIEPVVGAEAIAGSTRMKAGTAQKMVLNMLSTAAMVRLGYVYGNLMINVHTKNDKLRARAERILRQATGVGVKRAQRLLVGGNGDLRVAVLMAKTGLTARAAREALAAHRQSLRAALEALRARRG